MKVRNLLLICVLCLIATVAVGCSRETLLPQKGSEFEFEIEGVGGYTYIVFHADDDNLHKFNAGNVNWYYDRLDGNTEYAIVLVNDGGEEISADIHLLKSKDPQPTQPE